MLYGHSNSVGCVIICGKLLIQMVIGELVMMECIQCLFLFVQ